MTNTPYHAVRRPPWRNPLLWILDSYRGTPLVQEKDIPEPNPYWETSAACVRLKRRGLVTAGSDDQETDNMRRGVNSSSWTRVSSDFILQAEMEGRWRDVRRWARYNPVPVKGGPISTERRLRKVIWVVGLVELFMVTFILGKCLFWTLMWFLTSVRLIYESTLEWYETLILMLSATRSWAFRIARAVKDKYL
jgi:hypothetical protein